MSDFNSERRYPLVLVELRETGPLTHSLEDASRLAGIHPDLLLHYWRLGLFRRPMETPEGEPVFDDDSIYELLRFERFRRHSGMDRRTARLICGRAAAG